MMLLLERSDVYWWQKPLARVGGRALPAELVILHEKLRRGESGAWLNSRGITSGAVDLQPDSSGKLRTVRVTLPSFVSETLSDLYARTGLTKGAPDLVIWNESARHLRFVEVKCPDWDEPSEQQLLFHAAAQAMGIDCSIVEWRFAAR
jgi:hypothetical protein